MLWLVLGKVAESAKPLHYQTPSENRAASIETTTKILSPRATARSCFKIIKNLWRLVGGKHKKVEEIFTLCFNKAFLV